MKNVITCECNFYVNDEDIDAILSYVTPNGIGVWCDRVESDDGDTYATMIETGSLLFHNEETDTVYEMDKDMLLEGIARAIENQDYAHYHWYGSNNIDTESLDVDLIDCIIQYAIFGYYRYW